jgi:hypothetical protein
MKKWVVPDPGIDTDATWGYSRTKGWIFGYKLHLTSSSSTAGDLVVPLTADVTTANVPDNKMHVTLTSSLVFSLPSLHYMIVDPGYDAKKLYEYSKSIENRPNLSCRVIQKYVQKEAWACMLLSIGIRTGCLQPEKNIDRTTDRTYQINL